jgi:riboflavin synthase
MFSGLISHMGTVVTNEEDVGGRRLVIEAREAIVERIVPKDSIAVNGVCLTVSAVGTSRVAFDVVPETLACSTLGMLLEGEHVNVELSLRVGDRIGGHFVYGHVDTTAEILERHHEGQGARLVIATPPGLGRYLVTKGFVALDGISLTIAAATDGKFEVAVIPETLARTTILSRAPGDRLNVEIDPIARYALSSEG